MEQLWQSQKTAYEDSLRYLKGRQSGDITSILTPWSKVNDATTAGVEWHSMTVIGGRPGSGKTLMKDQIISSAFDLNPTEDFRALEFSLEMLGRNSAIRGYSAHVGRSYKYLCSADGTLTEDDFEKCVSYARSMVKYPIDIVETPPTVQQLKEIVHAYMEHHSKMEKVQDKEGNVKEVKVYKKTIMSIDHSLLIKKAKGQSRNDMLFELGETITELKRMYPIAWIILSQLNRDINRPERNEDGKYGNYILESDIFGSDALLQHADTVIGLNRPAKQKIRFYGPDRYIIENERVLVMHFLKCRNGEGGLAFFDAAFEKMSIEDMVTPPQAETRARA
jgi:replicative DNA helicase